MGVKNVCHSSDLVLGQLAKSKNRCFMCHSLLLKASWVVCPPCYEMRIAWSNIAPIIAWDQDVAFLPEEERVWVQGVMVVIYCKRHNHTTKIFNEYEWRLISIHKKHLVPERFKDNSFMASDDKDEQCSICEGEEWDRSWAQQWENDEEDDDADEFDLEEWRMNNVPEF